MYPELSFSEQNVPFEGIPNARELGGYKMSDGRHIRRGCLIRCGSLNRMTDHDVELLKSFGVGYIFDYRTNIEQIHRPDRIVEGIKYISLPCIDPKTDKMADSRFAKIVGKPDFEQQLAEYAFTQEAKVISSEMYYTLVLNEYTQLQYGTFLNYAASDGVLSILWHCSQGKDRTGLGAAFLLSVLGADRDLIIADFNLTNLFYRDQVNRVISMIGEKGGGEDEFDVARSLVGVNTRRFVEALDIIEAHYGSMKQYIKDQLCLDDSEVSQLKNKYLV